MPSIVKLLEERADGDVRFDQCRTGLETTKPTRFATKGLDFSSLHGLRCDHPVQEHTKPDGSKVRSAHLSTVQRWVQGDDGQMERASKSQGQYTPMLSEIIAKAFHKTQIGANWLREDLDNEDL